MMRFKQRAGLLAMALCLALTAGQARAASEGENGVLLVAFGTSLESARATYEGIEGAFARNDMPVVWAFTSNIIRHKMAGQGVTLFTVAEGLDELAAQGVTDVVVQSLHIMPGEEFSKMERLLLTEVLAQPDRFNSVRLGRPLLESMQDGREVAEATLAALPSARQPGDAVLLMSHGQSEGRCDLVFTGMNAVLRQVDSLAFMASVEGYQGLDAVLPELRAAGVSRVWLQPFMLVAGDHALNDMAGSEPDSWASRLRAEGFEVFPVLRGLGEQPGIQNVFARHARETHDDLAHPVIKTTADE